MQGEVSKGCENRILSLNASKQEKESQEGWQIGGSSRRIQMNTGREVQGGKSKMEEIIKKNGKKHDRGKKM